MSAESHQKRTSSTSSDTVRSMPNIVPPQAVSDRSILDSVAGFINDVALTNAPQTDPKEHILWVKFENLADISDTCLGDDWDVEGNLPPPLLLCIGYGSGVQVWAIPANGEAIEVMSWKHGSVKVLRVLPTPFLSNNSELANDLLDQFIHKRPLMALCGDCPIANQQTSSSSSSQNQQFNAVNFVSLKDGDLVKSIRFKSPIVDVVANRTSVAITFPERIAIFDARTLEDRLTVTTCYPCPGGLCPIALGDRWIAYAEKKLIPSKASAGGCFFDGVPSYTATVLNAAKSLGKGLRELGEQVAAGLTGHAGNMSNVHIGTGAAASNVGADGSQAGVVTILDIKFPIKDISPTTGTPVTITGSDPIVAHFLAHGDAITGLAFDPSGMILVTTDRRGHDFNVFRIQPHPSGSVLAAVHHLYVLHRGDTSAKVQDIAFSFDSRWVAVSTLRGTTHVFPITPYGGQPGYRTHSAPHVVNRLSRFHRSAGLSVDGRSSSPILMSEHAVQSNAFANPRLPPFPHPTVVLPLAQLRQPSSLSTGSSTSASGNAQQSSKGHMHGRQRHHSTEESHSKPLRLAAVFAKARSWLLEPPGLVHEAPSRLHRRAVDSLFIVAGHGALVQYDLEPRHLASIPKEKVCDETPIDLDVEAKAQWILGIRSNAHAELSPPLPSDNWLIKDRVIDNNLNLDSSQMEHLRTDERDDRWLSQVEIVTHAGPHRRLWMGPQFIFKTYNTPSGNSLAHIDVESVEVGAARAARSTPMNMPNQPVTASRPLVPVLIESGSCSSHEPSPRLLDSFHYENTDSDVVQGPDSQLREDLADAMRDATSVPVCRDSGSTCNGCASCKKSTDSSTLSFHSMSCDQPTSLPNLQTVVVSIVNPQGSVTTVTNPNNSSDKLEESFSSDHYIHENCDESMFRPVVTVFSDPNSQHMADNAEKLEEMSKPIDMPSQLIVPVIDEQLLQQRQREKEEQQKVLKEKQQMALEQAKLDEQERIEKIEAAKKLVEPKKEEAPPAANYQKKGKKSQKYNKKAPVESKSADKKEPSPPKSSLIDEKKPESKPIEPKIEPEQEIVKPDEVHSEPINEVIEAPPEPVIELEMIEIEPENIEEETLRVEPSIEFPSLPSIEPIKVKEIEPIKVKEVEPIKVKEVEPIKVKEVEPVKHVEQPVKKEWKGKKDKYKKNQQAPEIKPRGQFKNVDFQDFPPLFGTMPSLSSFESTPPSPPIDDHREMDNDAIMKISKHETIGDDEIEIIPHENIVEIHESPEKLDIEMIDDSYLMPDEAIKVDEGKFIKNEDFYDVDDLPPLETFDGTFDVAYEHQPPKEITPEPDSDHKIQKQDMKNKLSEILKNTNMVFAMCSSLKEIQDDEETKSMGSSQIQTSTSSLTTTTTTATFASATSSNQTGEGQDSDYKSLELDMEIENATDPQITEEFKMPDALPQIKVPVAEDEDISSFEATSSETDADDSSSKKSITKQAQTQFKREDDEELRPLLETSITSLTSPVSSSDAGGGNNTTDANDTSTLPEINQKSSQATSSNNGNKRKNKKKRR